jgi:putative transposase
VSAFRLIEAQRARFSVPLMCRILGVCRSGYYAWKNRAPSARAKAEAALTEQIKHLHRRSRGTYGAPRIHACAKASKGSAAPQSEWRD